MSLYVLYLQYLLLKARFGPKVQLPGVHHVLPGKTLVRQQAAHVRNLGERLVV